MADNLKITLSLTGLAAVLKGFASVQKAALDTQKAIESVNAGLVKGGGGKGASPLDLFIKRYAIIAKAQIMALDRNTAALAKFGGGTGGGGGGKSGGTRTGRTPPTFTRALERFFRSSRFGAAGIQPLVGQGIDLLGAAGLGEAAGPIGVLTTGAFEAGKALKKFADGAAETTSRLSSLRYGTGSNLREAGRLQGLAGAIGLSAEDASGVAAGIDAASTGGGLGAAYAMRAGIDIRPAPFGSTDRAKKALQALTYIANDKDETDATNFARQTGSEQFLKIRDLSPSARAQALADANTAYLSQRQVTTGADYQAARSNFDQARDRFFSKSAGPVERLGTRALNYGTDVLSGRRPVLPAWSDTLSNPAPTMQREGDVPSFAKASPRARAAFEQHEKALAAHTQALTAHTQAISKRAGGSVTYPGTFGNASRGDYAGENMGGVALQKALKSDREAFVLGAF